jgi:uncharacterized OB-fold protein
MALELPACAGCGYVVFPPRIACSRCRSQKWHPVLAERGEVEYVTTVRRSPIIDSAVGPVHLGLIRTEVGPFVIARIRDDLARGETVALSARGNTVFAARVQ